VLCKQGVTGSIPVTSTNLFNSLHVFCSIDEVRCSDFCSDPLILLGRCGCNCLLFPKFLEFVHCHAFLLGCHVNVTHCHQNTRCPNNALSVGRSTPDATARVANVWRQSYSRKWRLILARFTAAPCAFFTLPMGLWTSWRAGNRYGVPSFVAFFTLSLNRDKASSVIGMALRAAFVFPYGQKIVFCMKSRFSVWSRKTSSGRIPVSRMIFAMSCSG
jgi:hypothetical protein